MATCREIGVRRRMRVRVKCWLKARRRIVIVSGHAWWLVVHVHGWIGWIGCKKVLRAQKGDLIKEHIGGREEGFGWRLLRAVGLIEGIGWRTSKALRDIGEEGFLQGSVKEAVLDKVVDIRGVVRVVDLTDSQIRVSP